MSKEKAENRHSPIKKLLASCFNVSSRGANIKTTAKAAPEGGPEATMVASAKHFSTAHKVNLG